MFARTPRGVVSLPLSVAALVVVAACGGSSGGEVAPTSVANSTTTGPVTSDAELSGAERAGAQVTTGDPTVNGVPPDAAAAPTRRTIGPRSVLTGQGLVRQLDDDPPVLCLGPVARAYPPQCSGPLIFGLDWTEMPNYRQAQGVRWGEARVVGTYDGQAFTLIRPPIRSQYPFEPDLATGAPEAEQLCDDPFGETGIGFDGLSTEASRALRDVTALLEASDAYVSSFSSDGESVLNVMLVEGADAAQLVAQARAVWPGGLCIETRDAPPRAEVNQALGALSRADLPGVFSWAAANEGGLQVTVLLADEDTINGVNSVVSGFIDPEDVTIQGALVPLDLSG